MKDYLTKRQMENLDIATLSEERKNRIMTIKNSMKLSDDAILDFGSSASKELTEFSTELLKAIKLKDSPKVSQLFTELITELDKVDTSSMMTKKPSFFKRLFKVDELKNFIQQYDNVADVIEMIKTKLEACQYELKKDIITCDRYLEQNVRFINTLDDCVYAGKMVLKEVHTSVDDELMTIDPSDVLAVQDLNQKQNSLNRLDRKLYDLNLVRHNAVINTKQIALIKEGDAATIEKIQTSINTTIPLWETQMGEAIILMRQKNAVEMQKAVSDTTNRLLEMNSEILKNTTLDIAKEVQRGVIDIDVLEKSTQNLIDTLKGVREITKKGEADRANATKRLAECSLKLNQIVLSDSHHQIA